VHRILVFSGTPIEKEPIYKMMADQMEDGFEYYDLPAFEGKIKEIEMDEDYHDEKLLVVVDDFLGGKDKFMDQISHFATKSRKLSKAGCCFVIISQSYFDIPKLLRNQVSYNIFMRGFDKRDIKDVCSRFSCADLTVKDIYKLYLDATRYNDIEDFFLIDRRTPHDNLKFRDQFSSAYIINERAKKDFIKLRNPHRE
jgi:hypothetical protein